MFKLYYNILTSTSGDIACTNIGRLKTIVFARCHTRRKNNQVTPCKFGLCYLVVFLLAPLVIHQTGTYSDPSPVATNFNPVINHKRVLYGASVTTKPFLPSGATNMRVFCASFIILCVILRPAHSQHAIIPMLGTTWHHTAVNTFGGSGFYVFQVPQGVSISANTHT